MKTPYEYRAQAREVLQNRWGEAAIITAIIILLALLLGTSPVLFGNASEQNALAGLPSLGSLLLLPIQYAFYNVLLRAVRREEENWWTATWQIVSKQFGRYFIAGLLVMLISVLVGVFTLGIGAIIMAYVYSMVPFLLHDYPELSAREAMKISREMMSGQKWNLFLLDLSFIGWIILAILTMGIGALFVEPYQQTARAAFYQDLKEEKIVEDESQEAEETAVEEAEAEEANTEEQ